MTTRRRVEDVDPYSSDFDTDEAAELDQALEDEHDEGAVEEEQQPGPSNHNAVNSHVMNPYAYWYGSSQPTFPQFTYLYSHGGVGVYGNGGAELPIHRPLAQSGPLSYHDHSQATRSYSFLEDDDDSGGGDEQQHFSNGHVFTLGDRNHSIPIAAQQPQTRRSFQHYQQQPTSSQHHGHQQQQQPRLPASLHPSASNNSTSFDHLPPINLRASTSMSGRQTAPLPPAAALRGFSRGSLGPQANRTLRESLSLGRIPHQRALPDVFPAEEGQSGTSDSDDSDFSTTMVGVPESLQHAVSVDRSWPENDELYYRGSSRPESRDSVIGTTQYMASEPVQNRRRLLYTPLRNSIRNHTNAAAVRAQLARFPLQEYAARLLLPHHMRDIAELVAQDQTWRASTPICGPRLRSPPARMFEKSRGSSRDGQHKLNEVAPSAFFNGKAPSKRVQKLFSNDEFVDSLLSSLPGVEPENLFIRQMVLALAGKNVALTESD